MILLVTYGLKSWSLTIRGYHRGRVLGNRMQRKMCGAKKAGVRGRLIKTVKWGA
jgi:hypothetical protein